MDHKSIVPSQVLGDVPNHAREEKERLEVKLSYQGLVTHAEAGSPINSPLHPLNLTYPFPLPWSMQPLHWELHKSKFT